MCLYVFDNVFFCFLAFYGNVRLKHVEKHNDKMPVQVNKSRGETTSICTRANMVCERCFSVHTPSVFGKFISQEPK